MFIIARFKNFFSPIPLLSRGWNLRGKIRQTIATHRGKNFKSKSLSVWHWCANNFSSATVMYKVKVQIKFSSISCYVDEILHRRPYMLEVV